MKDSCVDALRASSSERRKAMPIVKAKSDTWCDYCKDEWGQIKDASGRTKWHDKAIRQAVVTTISETHLIGEPIVRSYCHDCLQLASRTRSGQAWSLADQIEYAKQNRQGQQIEIGSK